MPRVAQVLGGQLPAGFPVFPIYHIGSKIALTHTFPSPCVTSGKHHPAPHSSPGHIPEFLMCHIRSKNALQRTFPSSSATSGRRRDSTVVVLAFESAKMTPSNCAGGKTGGQSAKSPPLKLLSRGKNRAKLQKRPPKIALWERNRPHSCRQRCSSAGNDQ